jgi:GT2 family glycosyltransferase
MCAADHVVVLVGFNNPDEIKTAAATFRDMAEAPSVLVVENGGAPHAPDLEVIRPGRNVGYCGAVNLALGIAWQRGFRAVTIANSDIVVPPASFSALSHAIQSADSDVAVIGGVELREDGRVRTAGGVTWSPWTGTDRWSSRPPAARRQAADVLFVQGALVTFLPCIEQVGDALDERLFMYFDEVDLGLRVRRAGLRVQLASDVRFVHDNESGRYRLFRGYLLHRNRALVVRRFAGWSTPVAHVVGLGRIFIGAARRGRGIRPGYLAACLHGWWDGVRGQDGFPKYLNSPTA